MLSSTDLQTWTPVGDALPTLPRGRSRDARGRRVSSFSTAPTSCTTRPRWPPPAGECISTPTSGDPTGPFVDSSLGTVHLPDGPRRVHRPPALRRRRTARRICTGSRMRASRAAPAFIWAALLSPDGCPWRRRRIPCSPRTRRGSRLWRGPTWSTPRAPTSCSIRAEPGTEPGYGVGYADCAGPFGPCTKPSGAPILHSDAAPPRPGGRVALPGRRGQLVDGVPRLGRPGQHLLLRPAASSAASGSRR